VVVNILYATSQATIEKALAKLLKEGRIQLITKGRYSKYFRT
jgi:Fic family protein